MQQIMVSQISSEEHYLCHCFMKRDMLKSHHILAKPSFEFTMPVQFTHKRSRKYVVIRPRNRMQVACMMDSCLLCSLQNRDEHKIVKYSKSVFPAAPKQIMDKHNIICRGINGVDSNHLDSVEVYLSDYGFIEEPWLRHLSKHSQPSDLPDALMDETNITEFLNKEITDADFSSKPIYNECEASQESRYLDSINFDENDLIEEPWVAQSLLHSSSSDPKTAATVQVSEISLSDRNSPQESESQNPKIHEKLLDISENSLISSEKDSISTVILINSSICTMQRIAVLENGKLVELLLEPVKNNVQCDSIYLGVVTKLVPHMGGAFVNIGGPRPSLMDIKPYREPFLFPPIHSKGKDSIGSQFHKLVDDEIEDDSEEFMDDEFGDHENVESWEDLKGNYNGGVNSVGVAVEDDKYTGTTSRNGDQQQGNDPDHTLKEDKVVFSKEYNWARVEKGTKILVQVVKEELGTKGPTLTAYPKLRSRFWILISRCSTIGISKKILGVERTRLRVIAKTLQPPGFGVTVRTVAVGHSLEELQEDLEGLLSTWKNITEHAKSASFAADEGVDGAVPVMLHRAMGKTLSVVQDYFSEKVDNMIVDSPRIYHEVTNYLQEIAPDLSDRVELYNRASPLFDEYKIEEEIDNILSKRVTLANGGYLVIEQTEALFSIDVNGGQCMLGKGTSKEKAILDVNLAAAKQIARELRLRDIGGIIVVDFIDMYDDSDKRLVYEEVKKAVERDRSTVKVSELSKYGLMEMTRKRVRPSVTFMISEQCACCSGIGRVVALETSFSKIEHQICRLLSIMDKKANPEDPSSWPSFVLRVDQYMCNYLTSGKRTKLAVLSSSLKVWILLKVDRGFTRGSFDLKSVGDDKESKLQNKSAIPILRTREVGTNSFSKRLNLFPIKKWSTNNR